MSFTNNQYRFLVVWLALVVLGFASSLLAGVPLTLGYAMLLFTLGCLPPAVVLTVFRGAPARSVTEGLYADDHSRREVALRLERIVRHDRSDA